MRILVVDDSRAMRLIVMRTLRQAGLGEAEMVEAADGRQAFDAVRDLEPDLVLCDWNMPGLTGIELLAVLRRAGNTVPFGFVTSETSPEMRDAALAAGAAFVVGKPFTVEDFRAALAPVVRS